MAIQINVPYVKEVINIDHDLLLLRFGLLSPTSGKFPLDGWA